MNLFEIVKNGVSCQAAAELYGVTVRRNSMALCPFHPDKHPSLYVAEDHYHCYGCREHGDVIDFTAKLFGISAKNAAQKLASDFGLNSNPPPAMFFPNPKTPEMEQQYLERKCIMFLKEQVDMLHEQHRIYAPKEPGNDYDPRFLESCRKLPTVQYLLDMLLIGGALEREKAVELLLTGGTLLRKEAA